MFGGPQRVVYDLSKELARRGHEVTVYTTNALDRTRNFRFTRSEYEFDGFRVRYFKNILRPDRLYISPGIMSVVGNVRKFDLIHIHSWRNLQDMVMSMFARKFKIPYILQVHGGLPRSTGNCTLKLIYDLLFGYQELKTASRVIALSQMEAAQYRGMGVPEEKIATIPNGIDLSSYSDLPANGRFREKYGIEKGKRVILFLGRINRLKGIDFLINAFAYMIENMEYDALLAVAGPDDGYLDETKKLVRQHKIEDRVFFTGPLFGIRKVEAYVDASIVASLDSLKEVVFLLVPLEAAACGTPVVVAKSNYIAELVEKGKFGSCVEYGNVPELAIMLKEMLDNEDVLKQMGLNGHKFVSENFDWKSIVGKIEKVYEDVMKRNGECS